MYEKINNKEGIKYFPHIGSVFISDDKNLWANPFENKELRARCFFKILNEETMEIFFHLTQKECEAEEVRLQDIPYKTYFSGAYNQLNVCQMQAFGELHLLKQREEIEDFKKNLSSDLEGRTNDSNGHAMSDVTTQEKVKALGIASDGMFFKFIPISYAEHMYERG